MEARRKGTGRIDPGVEARRDSGVVRSIDLRSLHGGLDGNSGREAGPSLMRPDGPRRPPLDGPGAAAKGRFNRLRRGVGLLGRRGIQRCDRVSREQIEPGHGLRELLDAETRARRQTCRNAIGVSTWWERAEAQGNGGGQELRTEEIGKTRSQGVDWRMHAAPPHPVSAAAESPSRGYRAVALWCTSDAIPVAPVRSAVPANAPKRERVKARIVDDGPRACTVLHHRRGPFRTTAEVLRLVLRARRALDPSPAARESESERS